jgi:hypothetical protein
MRPTARVTNPALALLACLAALLVPPNPLWAESAPAAPQAAASRKPALAILSEALNAWADLIEPADATAPPAVTGVVKFAKVNGLPKHFADADVQFALQAPDRLKVVARVGDTQYRVGRDGRQLWAATRKTDGAPGFAVLGKSGVPRFKAFPNELDDTVLDPLALPISRLQLSLVPLMVRAKSLLTEEIAGQRCHVLSVALLPATAQLLGVDADGWHATLWVREADLLPAQVDVTDGKLLDVRVQFANLHVGEPLPETTWTLETAPNEKVETVALAHLKRFHEVAPKALRQQIPTLGPATGRREVVATSSDGLGRLERRDGTRVLFLAGSPEQMGRQHGELLKNEIRDVMDRILYGIGVGSSFGTGKWFFGEIEDAQARLEKFTDPRVLREMDALADAIGVHRQETRLANFFPELFHCSGFALMGKASGDGHLYHGRVLDYLKGVGLEQNAVLIVHRPADAHAWVNASYAGFVGSITAMNEKGIAIGEMGGGGYGDWDGKPMAQLLREVMERASTLDEAIDIMRKGPRTCEYYYVISSGKEMRAVGIAATPTRFETIDPGQAHPQLKRPVDDAVLLSAGDRYEELVNRVQGGYGKFGAEKALDLMTRPVCMTSNIQSVLFVPDTLDLYVANADGTNVASHTRFTKYNLRDLLSTTTGAAAAR